MRGSVKHNAESLTDHLQWAPKFCDLVVESFRKDPLETLVTAGCDLELVLDRLESACKKQLQSAVLEGKALAKEVRDLRVELCKLARRVHGMQHTLADYAVGSNAIAGTANVERTMLWYADLLEADEKQLHGSVPTRRLSRYELALLLSYIEGKTGDPHSREIAQLMEVFYEMRGEKKSVRPRSLERTLNRYKKENPGVYELMKKNAR